MSLVHVDSYKVEQCFYAQGLSEKCIEAGATVPLCYLWGEVPMGDGAAASGGGNIRKKRRKKKKKKTSKTAKAKKIQDDAKVMLR